MEEAIVVLVENKSNRASNAKVFQFALVGSKNNIVKTVVVKNVFINCVHVANENNTA